MESRRFANKSERSKRDKDEGSDEGSQNSHSSTPREFFEALGSVSPTRLRFSLRRGKSSTIFDEIPDPIMFYNLAPASSPKKHDEKHP